VRRKIVEAQHQLIAEARHVIRWVLRKKLVVNHKGLKIAIEVKRKNE